MASRTMALSLSFTKESLTMPQSILSICMEAPRDVTFLGPKPRLAARHTVPATSWRSRMSHNDRRVVKHLFTSCENRPLFDVTSHEEIEILSVIRYIMFS